MQKAILLTVATLCVAGCQQASNSIRADLSSYEYCSQDHQRLEAEYARDLAAGKFPLDINYVQPANIKEKCLVKLWTQGQASTPPAVTWHGECKNGYADKLGLLMIFAKDGSRDSMRLYEGDGHGGMTAYYGISEGAGKLWSGRDDGDKQTFFVCDLKNPDSGFSVARTDYKTAESYDFIFDDDSLAMIRLYPNYSEEFSRSYSDGDYTSDLFYSMFEIPKDAPSRMSGVAFTYSGADRSMTVMDAVGGKEPVVSKDQVSARYLNEIMDLQQQLVDTMNGINAELPRLMQTARMRMQEYQRRVCSLKQYEALHINLEQASEICSLQVLAPTTMQ